LRVAADQKPEGLVRWVAPQPRIQLILGAAVCSRVKVARAARLPIASDLHVPEEGLAEHQRGLHGSRTWIQELTEVRNDRRRDMREAVEPGVTRRLSYCPWIWQCWTGCLCAHGSDDGHREQRGHRSE